MSIVSAAANMSTINCLFTISPPIYRSVVPCNAHSVRSRCFQVRSSALRQRRNDAATGGGCDDRHVLEILGPQSEAPVAAVRVIGQGGIGFMVGLLATTRRMDIVGIERVFIPGR